MAHGSQKLSFGTKESESEEIDVIDKLLNETGCADFHYKVQDCIAETKDWRMCQREVRDFRECINVYNKKKKTDDVEHSSQ